MSTTVSFKSCERQKTLFFYCISKITPLFWDVLYSNSRDQWASLINLVLLSMWKDADSPAFHFLFVVNALCGTKSWICQHCVGSLYFDLLQTERHPQLHQEQAQAVKVNSDPTAKLPHGLLALRKADALLFCFVSSQVMFEVAYYYSWKINY